jgi:hypothetical protein
MIREARPRLRSGARRALTGHAATVDVYIVGVGDSLLSSRMVRLCPGRVKARQKPKRPEFRGERVADRLTKILQDNLPEEHAEEYADAMQTLTREYARNERDVVKVNKFLARISLSMDDIRRWARADKAQELVQGYLRREPDAVTLVDELLADAGRGMDSFMTGVLGDRIDEIERIDRLTAIAEARRNAALREIDRRGAVLGETLRRSVREIENDDFADGEVVHELPPAKGKNAA